MMALGCATAADLMSARGAAAAQACASPLSKEGVGASSKVLRASALMVPPLPVFGSHNGAGRASNDRSSAAPSTRPSLQASRRSSLASISTANGTTASSDVQVRVTEEHGDEASRGDGPADAEAAHQAACKARYWEVTAKVTTDRETGNRLLLLQQVDVTGHAAAEGAMSDLTETQLAMLSQVRRLVDTQLALCPVMPSTSHCCQHLLCIPKMQFDRSATASCTHYVSTLL